MSEPVKRSKTPAPNTPEAFAQRYCEAQHDPKRKTALKRLMGKDAVCSVCGKAAAR